MTSGLPDAVAAIIREARELGLPYTVRVWAGYLDGPARFEVKVGKPRRRNSRRRKGLRR